ncbi:OB-fold nucleic acid binding domain-containing protein [Streptomyces sp. NPDC056002]|uniref:OB-fold nucleic acid binding domain-containing protein n=1 Tax=Streptomyces sp. NPDC056002 TaxID=3345675 RepID=UPI0035DF4B7A
MYRARIKDNGAHVFAVQIDNEPAWYTDKHKLTCWKCDAAVNAKGTYVKRNGASYRAHFALNPNTRHTATCPFNPVEVITSIAQGAQGLAHVDDGVLKLTLPGDLKDVAPVPDETKPLLPPQDVTAQQINTVPPPLPPLLNCAAKIARFLQLNAFDDKVVAKFKVQPYGRKTTIPWGRFCYGPTTDAYAELAARLDPQRPEKTAPSHPIAVYGTVQRVRRDNKGRRFVYLADHGDLDGKEFEVVLRSMHPTLIKPLTAGTHVLAVGTWKVFNRGRVPQLVLFADEAWQIAYWHSDENTGTTTQPTSPPALTPHQRATERPARTPATRARRPTQAAGGRSGRRRDVPMRRTTTPPPATPPAVPTPPAVAAPDSTQQRPHPPAPAAPQSPPAGPPRTPPPAPAVPSTDQQPITPAVLPIPPKPSRPPRPVSPPLPPRRRRRAGLAGWLRRRKKRRD